MATGVVIYDDEWGIYLGVCLGLGFWSKLDPVGQKCAVAFKTKEDAQAHVATWESNGGRPYLYIEVEATPDARHPDVFFSSIEQCVKAGLPAWEPGGNPREAPETRFMKAQANMAGIGQFRNFMLQSIGVSQAAFHLEDVVAYCCMAQIMGQMARTIQNGDPDRKDETVMEMLVKNFEQGCKDYDEARADYLKQMAGAEKLRNTKTQGVA